ncbi:MAG: IMS domain-containing protein [Prochlorococcaceae cyanobacterium]
MLRTLQQRIDRPPSQGFTQDGLQARAELLRASAELLSDQERRQDYEIELTSLHGLDSLGRERIPALEIPTSREVGGLLLLLEADQPQEAFELACRGLEPPQAPALGSSREADLTLLAALACEASANSLHQQRHFESAAAVLHKGIQLLQRMGQLPDRRQRLLLLRESLLPYRVLDLLSRDLGATSERQEGLQLLELLVQRRGGLEGDQDSSFSRAEFQPFFEQIRQFLTVQEQVDLFSRWADGGSAEAERLTTLALTASGFAQRKPERLAAAIERLSANAIDGQPATQAWLQLLLGQVEKGPQQQAPQGQSLAERCAECRDWLNRDVLPGYRDVDADADLEAWFADRDVQAWIERQDRREARSSSSSSDLPFSAADDAFTAPPEGSLQPWPEAEPIEAQEGFEGEQHPRQRRWRPQGLALPLAGAAVAATMAIAVGLASLRGFQRQANTPEEPKPQPTAGAKPALPSATVPAPAKPEAAKPEAVKPAPVPLRSAEPAEPELRALLASWLAAKATILAGRPAATPLNQMATAIQVQRLESQRRQDAAKGLSQEVEARIENLRIVSRTPARIETEVDLRYSDQRLNAAGQTLARTTAMPLRNRYVFSKEGGIWRLASYRPMR